MDGTYDNAIRLLQLEYFGSGLPFPTFGQVASDAQTTAAVRGLHRALVKVKGSPLARAAALGAYTRPRDLLVLAEEAAFSAREGGVYGD